MIKTPFKVIDERVFFVGNAQHEPIAVTGGISGKSFAIVKAFQDGYLWAGYLRDEKGVWWFHERDLKAKFVSTDAEAFRVIDDDYGLDSRHLYLEDGLVPGADPASFSLIDNGTYFARDANRLYVKDGTHFFHFDEIAIDTLIANGPFLADSDHLFHHGSTLKLANYAKHREKVAYSLDGEHDMLLKDWLAKHHPEIVGWWHPDYPFSAENAQLIAHDWFRTDRAVFFREKHGWTGKEEEVFNLVRGADPASFQPLDMHHARDAAGVFCRWRRLKTADASSFEALGGLFGRDGSGVWFNGYRVEGADPTSFVPLETERPFGKDRHCVFTWSLARTSWPFGHPDYILAPLDGADPRTFRAFGSRGAWAADAERVYLHGKRMKKLDAGSFRFLAETATNGWAQDTNGLYRSNGTLKIGGIDGRTFVKLNEFWGNDGKAVFSFVTGAIQKAIDASTFEVTDEFGGARDAKAAYSVEKGSVKKRRFQPDSI